LKPTFKKTIGAFLYKDQTSILAEDFFYFFNFYLVVLTFTGCVHREPIILFTAPLFLSPVSVDLFFSIYHGDILLYMCTTTTNRAGQKIVDRPNPSSPLHPFAVGRVNRFWQVWWVNWSWLPLDTAGQFRLDKINP
jgi:hypothetical protein